MHSAGGVFGARHKDVSKDFVVWHNRSSTYWKQDGVEYEVFSFNKLGSWSSIGSDSDS